MNLILLFILGTILGSFLNVCIYRLPREESIVFPPSHCPHCGTKLKVYELIPIISYFIQKGKCGYCSQTISWRYPVVEFITGLAFVLLFLKYGYTLDYLFLALFTSLLIILTFTDIEQEIIPDVVVLGGVVVGLLYNLLHQELISSVIGGVCGWVFMFALAKIASRVLGKEAMGEGDIKLALMLGIILGFPKVFLGLFLAFLFGAVVGLLLLALKIKNLRDHIPFGPALAGGGLVAAVWGREILSWYLSLLT